MCNVMAFLALALLSLMLMVSCDFVQPVANVIPFAGKCHDRQEGSVLSAVEDASGKKWPVVGEYPPVNFLGTTISEGGICAVSVEAGHSMYLSNRGFLQEKYWLHPETGERIVGGFYGSQKGLLDIDESKYEWY